MGDEAVVADGHIAQYGILDARMLHKALGDLDVQLEDTKLHFAVELHAPHPYRHEVVGYGHIAPVLSPTAVVLQLYDFVIG